MLVTVLIIILVLLLIGGLPAWPYSSGWGYGPSGLLGLLLFIVIILASARQALKISRLALWLLAGFTLALIWKEDRHGKTT
jgi:hypothetical protein